LHCWHVHGGRGSRYRAVRLLRAAVPGFPTGNSRPMPSSRSCVPPLGWNRCIRTTSTGLTGALPFEVSVEVDRTLAASALADIGRRLVEQVDHADFTGHVLSLSIGFPLSGPGSDKNNCSRASFNLTDDGGGRLKDVTADQVGADLQFWIEVVPLATGDLGRGTAAGAAEFSRRTKTPGLRTCRRWQRGQRPAESIPGTGKSLANLAAAALTRPRGHRDQHVAQPTDVGLAGGAARNIIVGIQQQPHRRHLEGAQQFACPAV
jgi:hypothetical protein